MFLVANKAVLSIKNVKIVKQDAKLARMKKIVQTTKQEAAVELLILASAITSNISFGIGWGLLSPSYINFFHYEI